MVEGKFKMDYDPEEDTLYIYQPNKKAKESVEIEDDIVIDIDKNNNLIAVEFFYASKLFSNLNKIIDKKFLSGIEDVTVKTRNYRNLLILTIVFLRKNEKVEEKLCIQTRAYESPLIASASA